MFKTKALAATATLLMAVCVMPKPAPEAPANMPAFEIGCSSPDGGESCLVVDHVLSEDYEPLALPACWSEEDVDPLSPCVWDARKEGNGQGLSYVLNPDGTVELLSHA